MASIQDLVAIMAKLRSPEGCPWDREQTHQSLKPHLIEEAYEVLDAVDSGHSSQLQEELGDVLLQVVFHSQIAAEQNQFTLEDVIAGICAKLTRRHPHVFADATAANAEDVIQHWEAVKRQEKQDAAASETPPSIFDSVPRQLPALLRAEKLQKRAARLGFDWPDLAGPLAKIDEELEELRQALAERDQDHILEELGDVLFSVVNVARFVKANPELTLDRTNQKFMERFQAMEQQAAAAGLDLHGMSLEEMDELWRQAKEKPSAE